jgi:hypothetical protein
MHTKTLLTRPVRIIIMLFLILSFFIISPLIILYTAGYRYDIGSGIVRETGVLSLDVGPKDVDVFLDDVYINKAMPVRLTNLIPSTYHLSIEKEHYHSWEKDIVIESKQTTYIRNISLFQNTTPNGFLQTETSFANMVASPDAQFVIITTQKDNEQQVFLSDTQDGSARHNIISVPSTVTIDTDWSPYHNYGVVQLMRDDTVEYIIFSASNPTQAKTYVFDRSLGEVARLQWHTAAQVPTLFVQHQNAVYRIDPQQKTYVRDVPSTQWFVDQDEQIWVISEDQFTIDILKGNQKEQKRLLGKVTDILSVTDRIVIAKDTRGIVVLEQDGAELKELASLSTDQIRFNPKTGEWISWSPWEIWNIYEDGSTALLNRTSDPVEDVWPLDEFGVLLLVRKHSLVGFNPGYFIEHILLDSADIRSVGVDLTQKKIIFFGSVENSSDIWELPY